VQIIGAETSRLGLIGAKGTNTILRRSFILAFGSPDVRQLQRLCRATHHLGPIGAPNVLLAVDWARRFSRAHARRKAALRWLRLSWRTVLRLGPNRLRVVL
jgi:hypothetical protein